MDSNQSSLKPEFDSTISRIKRAGRKIKEKIKEFTGNLSFEQQEESNEILQQQIAKKFMKLTEDQKDIPIIKAWELLKILNDSTLVLIDTRQPYEQEVSMIPGAYTPLQFAKKYNTPASLEKKKIVTYCTIGYRSGEYAGELIAHKIKVFNLEGGILSWSHNNGPLVTIEKGRKRPSKKVHIYDKEWNYLHSDYIAIW